MSSTPLLSYNDLLAALTRDGVMHQASPAERSVMIPTRIGASDAAMILRWAPDQGALHVVQSLPLAVPAEARAAVSHAMNLLNHALALPGFGLDHENRRLYFRTVLPITPGGVNPADVQALFRAMVRTSLDLLPPIRRVLEGGASPEGVVVDASIELTLGDSGGTLL